MRARTAQWVAGCTAAGSVALIGGGVALAYLNRHLVPASLTGWTVSNVSRASDERGRPGSGLCPCVPAPGEPDWLAVPGGGPGVGPERLFGPVRAARPWSRSGVLPGGPGVQLAIQCNPEWSRSLRLPFCSCSPMRHVRSRRAGALLRGFIGHGVRARHGMAAYRRNSVVGAHVHLIQSGDRG